MTFKKQLKQAMLKKNVEKRRTSNTAKVYAVNEDHTVDIVWKDAYTNKIKYAYNLNFPDNEEGLGLYTGDPQEGDLIEINFLTENKDSPYIVSLRNQVIEKNFRNNNGSSIPNYFSR